MFQLIGTLFQLIFSAFHPDKRIRTMGSFAALCLLVSVAFAVATTWLSQPAYATLFPNNDPLLSWGVAGLVGAIMFFGNSIIGKHAAELSERVPTSISNRTLGYVVMLVVMLGAYDTWKGYQVGSQLRSRERHQVLSYEEATASQAKPYEDQIAKLQAEIDRLRSDENRIMWQGKLVTPWTDRQTANRLSKRVDELYAMQAKAIDEQRALHQERTTQVRELQDDSQETWQGISIVLYFLQIFAGIPLGLFSVMYDMQDGVRDFQNRNQSKGPGLLGRMRQWVSNQGDKREAELQPTAEESRRPIGYERPGNAPAKPNSQSMGQTPGDSSPGNPQAHSPQDSPVNSPGDSPAHSPTSQPRVTQTVRKEIELNTHPRFSAKVQPDTYRGVDTKKYRKFLVIAQSVHDECGRYNLSEISNRTKIDRKTLRKYLTAALDSGDLEK